MADELLKQQIDEYIDNVWEDLVADIATLVEVDSVEDLASARPGAPWGEGPAEALRRALDIAGRIGLEPTNCDGYIGFADLPGASTKQLATIGHVDIVPVGTGWRYSPFELAREDGCLVARGVEDDKGPTVLSLYAAKFFLDRGEQLPYTMRCIIGCNEETGMADVDWYLEHYPQPDFLFTPDGVFPVCYGEKGLYGATFTSAELPEDRTIVELTGGIVTNAVPGEAEALVRADAAALPAAERIEVEPAGEGLARIYAHGIGGHASKPEGTINAIKLLVEYLVANNLFSCEAEEQFLRFEQMVLATTDGSNLGIACADEYFDPLTIIGGTVCTKDGHFQQTVDSRYPTAITGEQIDHELSTRAAEFGVSFAPDRAVVPYVTDPESDQIKILVDTYNEVAGKDEKPFTMGGGTYARHFARAASFGPGNQGYEKPAWVNSEHSPNEGVYEHCMKRALKVYILAISRLMNTEL